MSSDQVQSAPSAVAGGLEGGSGIMTSSEPNRQAGGLGLQKTASKDLGSALPGGVLQGAFGNAPLGGGLRLQRTMSRDMGGAGAQPGGLKRTMSRDLGGAGEPGGLQRTMSRDLGGAAPQPGGLQRTMSRDLGGGAQSGGLQRTMSRDLGMSNAQSGGGGLQRTISKGLGNIQSDGVHRTVPRDASRQPRKTPGKAERVPRLPGGQEALPRHNTASS